MWNGHIKYKQQQKQVQRQKKSINGMYDKNQGKYNKQNQVERQIRQQWQVRKKSNVTTNISTKASTTKIYGGIFVPFNQFRSYSLKS